jgi:8-oxo-dGTP pyrophosphatase MutT (NUDIX family)
MTLKPWKVIESTRLQGPVRIDRCELPNGLILDATVLDYRDWVTVLALTRRQEAVLIRQYRHGAGRVIEELPGGTMDVEDVSPLEAARRELREETGYISEKFIQIGCVSPNPANQTNRIYSFLALEAEPAAAQDLDEGEDIEVLLKPFEELVRMARDGELLQSMQVSAVFFALSHLKRIQA